MEFPFESDHYPEIVENGKGTRRLELFDLKEPLRISSSRREFFSELSNEDYKKMLGYINSITRGQKIETDYGDGKMKEPTPPLEDKEELMNLTFDTIRAISRNTTLDDETALRRAGLTIACALNYIHPYKNGNGRVGRLMHYLIEFGSEREAVFDDEVYAIIAKLPVYTTDKKISLVDQQPPELDKALNIRIQEETQGTIDVRKAASARVVAFLSMMRGEIEIPIKEDISRLQILPSGNQWKKIPANTIDGRSLYENDYLFRSEIPNRKSAVPSSERVLGTKR